jgi:alcohol dehydrogenase class IV
VIFSDVVSDPPVEVVEQALAFSRQKAARAVIGLGGGSSMDAAKGLAVCMASDVSLREYGAGIPVEGPIAPLYAIPTTAGTGSEVTRVSVITDAQKKEKMSIRGEHLAPLAAVLDPELIAGLPASVAAETGADALTHAVEAYVSLNSNPITDALAISAIEMIANNLPDFVADSHNREAGLRMLLASCLAGQAFSNGGLGLAHSMGEPLGSYFHLSHGLACALFLPVIMEFNLPEAPAKFAKIAHAMGQRVLDLDKVEAAALSVRAVKDLFRKIGLPENYQKAGISFELHPQMVKDVFPQFSTTCNPRETNTKEIEALYMALA